MNLATLKKEDIAKDYPFVVMVDMPKADLDSVGRACVTLMTAKTSGSRVAPGGSRLFQASSRMEEFGLEPGRFKIQGLGPAPRKRPRAGAPARRRRRPGMDLWAAAKSQFYLFACTDDKKYAKLRTKIRKQTTKASTLVVSTISGAIAGALGVAAGLIAPLVALLLYFFAKIGLESWCSLEAVKLGHATNPRAASPP